MEQQAEMGSLMAATLDLLRGDERSTYRIARDGNFEYHWLAAFRRGTMKDPSVNRTQKLFEYLTGAKLGI